MAKAIQFKIYAITRSNINEHHKSLFQNINKKGKWMDGIQD